MPSRNTAIFGATSYKKVTLLRIMSLCDTVILNYAAYTDYHTKFVSRKCLQPPSTHKFEELCLPQRKKEKKKHFSFVKICTGSKHYVTQQTTAIARYYCTNILVV